MAHLPASSTTRSSTFPCSIAPLLKTSLLHLHLCSLLFCSPSSLLSVAPFISSSQPPHSHSNTTRTIALISAASPCCCFGWEHYDNIFGHHPFLFGQTDSWLPTRDGAFDLHSLQEPTAAFKVWTLQFKRFNRSIPLTFKELSHFYT